MKTLCSSCAQPLPEGISCYGYSKFEEMIIKSNADFEPSFSVLDRRSVCPKLVGKWLEKLGGVLVISLQVHVNMNADVTYEELHGFFCRCTKVVLVLSRSFVILFWSEIRVWTEWWAQKTLFYVQLRSSFQQVLEFHLWNFYINKNVQNRMGLSNKVRYIWDFVKIEF